MSDLLQIRKKTPYRRNRSCVLTAGWPALPTMAAVGAQTELARRQRFENSLMLALLKAGCKSGDVLSAQVKGIDMLIRLAEAQGLEHVIPAPTMEAPPSPTLSSEGTEGSYGSPTATERTVRFVTPPPPPPPPSNLPQGIAALTRARAWRYQHMSVFNSGEAGPSGHPAVVGSAAYATVMGDVHGHGPEANDAVGAGAGTGSSGHGPSSCGPSSSFGFTPLDDQDMEEGPGGHYEGERNGEGERHGRGVYRFADGGVYEGSWVDNLQEGWGAMRYASGSVYEGTWRGGMQDGRGIFRFVSGSEYDGEWVRGKRHGKATYRYADGRAEVARYRDGANDRSEGAMWSADRRVAWRIVRDGEYVEEISLDEAKRIADAVGEAVPPRTR